MSGQLRRSIAGAQIRLNIGSVGGNELSEIGTPLLPFAFPARQSSAAAALEGSGVLRCHRGNDVEQIAERQKSLAWRPGTVCGDLLADRSIECRICRGHLV
jgi:hypothetical protein